MLTARLNGSRIEIFNASTGSIQRTHELPPGNYSGLIISGNIATVTIQTKYSGDKIRTINLQTGGIVSEINM